MSNTESPYMFSQNTEKEYYGGHKLRKNANETRFKDLVVPIGLVYKKCESAECKLQDDKIIDNDKYNALFDSMNPKKTRKQK